MKIADLYWEYYKKLQRGFTDAEFQQACEKTAGISLTPVFEYVYTTRDLDYDKYLGYGGLRVNVETNAENGKKKFSIRRLTEMTSLQQEILQAWLNGYKTSF